MHAAIRLVSILALASVTPFATTADDAGSWINLFDGETLFGWNTLGDAGWQIKDGAISCTAGSGGMIASTSTFQNFELSAQIRIRETTSTGLVFRAGLDGHPEENGSSILWLRERKNSGSPWRDIHIVANGGDIDVTVDGKKTAFHQGENTVGHIGLLYHHNNNGQVAMRNVKLRPIGLTPLFNGKNLNGWNIIPGHASTFSVVDGAISIKNGNGQIETAGTYCNYILQLDIISNGDHLNSGVFVRGPVGVFWKGYESQVRNQWRRDDRTRPVDFGTGGNYGNQAARKVVSSDHEWFTKTIVLDNNHMAVWIDGYLVSDFLDTRPISKNADGKTGFVQKAGTIHLQGHDPTTDLSFKNILIQEYPSQ